MFIDKYYKNMELCLLVVFGEFFVCNVCIYVYFFMQEGSVELMMVKNLLVFDGFIFLYWYLFDNQQIVDVVGFNCSNLYIFFKDIFCEIWKGVLGWESQVFLKVVVLIKEKCLFGYFIEILEFDYQIM